ncbi:DUF2786 domain-containing protein [Corynebacterium sp. H128]|uniref:DUF2786 domain-containing protein n=1 Tax=unclassified Corynebacterium TaxID=2624378 RepID=UPI0030A20FF3
MMERIKARVRKLLNQAIDRQGTPEGDVFYEKAFQLLAQYGLDRSELEADDGAVMVREFPITGNYSAMQARLLLSIAEVLHCVGFNIGLRPSRIASVTLFGMPRHLDRIELLYSILRLSMLSGAQRIDSTMGLVRARRSFMAGFVARISQRLAAAEAEASDSAQAYALALIDDRTRANQVQAEFLRQQQLQLSQHRSRQQVDPRAYRQGTIAGDGTDIGQTGVAGMRAIG